MCPTVPHLTPLSPTAPHCAPRITPLCPIELHCAPLRPTAPHLSAPQRPLSAQGGGGPLPGRHRALPHCAPLCPIHHPTSPPHCAPLCPTHHHPTAPHCAPLSPIESLCAPLCPIESRCAPLSPAVPHGAPLCPQRPLSAQGGGGLLPGRHRALPFVQRAAVRGALHAAAVPGRADGGGAERLLHMDGAQP